MRKKILFSVIALILLLIFSGIFYYEKYADNSSGILQNQDTTFNEKELNSEIVEISFDDVKGITKEKAEELCYFVMGDRDDETGFLFSFGASAAIETRTSKSQYYVIRASWLVNNSHMSYIGDFFVSADGKEIYNGTALNGEYIIGDIIWKE